MKIKTFWALKWQWAKWVPFGPKKLKFSGPPHPYRTLDETMKKSTAPYKVHKIRLQYIIFFAVFVRKDIRSRMKDFFQVSAPSFEITSRQGRSHLSSTAQDHLANPSLRPKLVTHWKSIVLPSLPIYNVKDLDIQKQRFINGKYRDTVKDCSKDRRSWQRE
jgi:hypothetical protein